jgi:hypothetical protein
VRVNENGIILPLTSNNPIEKVHVTVMLRGDDTSIPPTELDTLIVPVLEKDTPMFSRRGFKDVGVIGFGFHRSANKELHPLVFGLTESGVNQGKEDDANNHSRNWGMKQFIEEHPRGNEGGITTGEVNRTAKRTVQDFENGSNDFHL